MKLISLEKEQADMLLQHGGIYVDTGIKTNTRKTIMVDDFDADFYNRFEPGNTVTPYSPADALFEDFDVAIIDKSHFLETEGNYKNQQACTVTKLGPNRYLIEADEADINTYISAATPAPGKVAWFAMMISTGEDDIKTIKLNSYTFTDADITEAEGVGGDAGDFVLWTYLEKGYVNFTLTMGGVATVITLELKINK